MSKTYPGLNRLLVKQGQLPSTGSIISVTEAQKYAYGEIIAVGSIKDAKDIKADQFEVGDNVYFLAQSGIDIDLPEGTFRLLQMPEVLIGIKKEG